MNRTPNHISKFNPERNLPHQSSKEPNMRPYFSIGEEVILCSKRYPEKNGDYTINKILFRGDKFICRITGILVEYDGSLGYLLDSPIIDVLCREGTEAIWPQSSLRKKHKPADQSFSDLIKSTREIKV